MDDQLKWDLRWLRLCKEVATWSKDPLTQVGSWIVRGKNESISFGYNGFPKNMWDDPQRYADREDKHSRVIHAEMNAAHFAKESIEGCTLYSTLMPCDRCFVHLMQKGIKRCVYLKTEERPWFEIVREYAKEANIEMVELDIDINSL